MLKSPLPGGHRHAPNSRRQDLHQHLFGRLAAGFRQVRVKIEPRRAKGDELFGVACRRPLESVRRFCVAASENSHQ